MHLSDARRGNLLQDHRGSVAVAHHDRAEVEKEAFGEMTGLLGELREMHAQV